MVLQKSNSLTQTAPDWFPDLLQMRSRGPTVVAQLGQSLDGQVATATGESKYINGPDGLLHLHRLRAWADVVLVGVGTVIADDPQLTVRLVPGAHPVRLVIDPAGRLPTNARMLTHDSVAKFVVTRPNVSLQGLPVGVEQVQLQPDGTGAIEPRRVLDWVEAMGWSRVLLEGGPQTLARFLEAGCIDYLHLITSALLLGKGKPGLSPPIPPSLAQGRRFAARPYALGQDLLIECDLR